MECLGYNEDSPVLGTDGLCRFHWTAPHPHFVGSFDANGGYPLQEPGSLNLVNASTPQQPTFDTTLGEDFLLYLDPSKYPDIGIHDSGHPFPQTSNPHNSVVSEEHQQFNSSSESWCTRTQHSRISDMQRKAHRHGSSSKHGCIRSQYDIAPVQSRNTHNAVPLITGKRARSTHTPNGISAKVARICSQVDGRGLSHTNSRNLSHAKARTKSSQYQEPRNPSYLEPRQAAVSCKLTNTQKRFIQQWYNGFAKGNSGSSLAYENISALATLMQVTSQLVMEYTQQQFVVGPTAKAPNSSQISGSSIFTEASSSSTSGYSLVQANRHLPTTILEIVEKYILACHRRRPQTDGRRRVNQGAFRCTYGCGYQTKRLFDWRRHEETHEPQELWLCYLCGQSQDQNPFLVNRRDKFLGHSKSSHKDFEPEAVLEMSKLTFYANFNPQCPFCPEKLGTWDERCKHIQQHYEDELHRGSRAEPRHSKLSKRAESISGEESSNQEDRSDSTDSSDEEDSHQSSPRSDFDERDPTGGSGGGSGNTSGYSSFRGGVAGQDNEVIPDTGLYEPYFSMSHAGYSQKAFATRYSDDDDTIKGVCKEIPLLSGLSCQNQAYANINLRTLATPFLTQFQQMVQEESNTLSQAHTSGHPRIEELDATEDERITAKGLSLRISLSSQEEILVLRSISGSTAPSGQGAGIANSKDKAEMEKERSEAASSNPCTERESSAFSAHAVACTFENPRKKRSFAFFGLHDSFPEHMCPTLNMELPNVATDVYTFQLPPPAYNDSSLYPVSISAIRGMVRGSSQPQALVYVTGMTGILGKVGMKRRHEFQHPPPSALTQSLCHRCGRRFVAPRLQRCGCSHIRCDKCTVVRIIPCSREVNDLVAIGSHSLPPAYSFQDIPGGVSTGDPLTELLTGNTVLTPVIAETIDLGNGSEERHIEEGISTVDRIHLQEQDPDSIYLTLYSSQRPSDTASRTQHHDFDSEAPTSTLSSALPAASLQSKQAKLDNHKRLRLSRRESRHFISSRSKQSVRIKQPQAMNDYTTHPKLDSQDLTSRLQRVQRSNSVANDGDLVSRITRTGTDETTSSGDSASVVFSRLPGFRKAKTSSPAGNNGVSGIEVVRTIPTSATNRESVEVDAGEFSKPTIRRRRASDESSKSHKEFQYYGRHANSWLFNDFSISEKVKKGWVKVFSPKSEGGE